LVCVCAANQSNKAGTRILSEYRGVWKLHQGRTKARIWTLLGWDDVVMMTEEEEEVEEEEEEEKEEEEAKKPHCSPMNNPNEQARKAESLIRHPSRSPNRDVNAFISSRPRS
jgi:hypothetical protein